MPGSEDDTVPSGLRDLVDLVGGGHVAVLTGAGLSTESGIPDYRGPSGALRARLPMTFQDFRSSSAARRRYWARSHAGWHTFRRARPNDGHRAVAALEAAGLLRGTVTQNVDGLHAAAGSRDVVELHGSLDRVVCLTCGDRSSREALAERLDDANPGFGAGPTTVNPDGDVELPAGAVEHFRLVTCVVCGLDTLKPDVVFFGETVPPDRVARSYEVVEGARCLLVLGSSLVVMSGFRFVLRASKHAIPVAVVNQGVTRGDAHAAVRVDAPLGQVLPALVDRLGLVAGPVPARSDGVAVAGGSPSASA